MFNEDTTKRADAHGDLSSNASGPESTYSQRSSSPCPIRNAPPAVEVRCTIEDSSNSLLKAVEVQVEQPTTSHNGDQISPPNQEQLEQAETARTAPEESAEHKLIAEVARNFVVSY